MYLGTAHLLWILIIPWFRKTQNASTILRKVQIQPLEWPSASRNLRAWSVRCPAIRIRLSTTCPTSDNPLGVISLSSLTTYSIFRIFKFTLRMLFLQRFLCFYFTTFTLFCTVADVSVLRNQVYAYGLEWSQLLPVNWIEPVIPIWNNTALRLLWGRCLLVCSVLNVEWFTLAFLIRVFWFLRNKNLNRTVYYMIYFGDLLLLSKSRSSILISHVKFLFEPV